MADTSSRKQLEDWLTSAEGKKLLNTVAINAAQEIAGKRIITDFMPISLNESDLTNEDYKETLSALKVFILTKRDAIQKALLSDRKDKKKYLKRAFINSCMIRSADKDKLRYLRKRANDIMRQSPHFYTKKDELDFILYSFRKKDGVKNIFSLSKDERGAIAFPENRIPPLYDSLKSGRNIQFLLKYFWGHTAKYYGRPVWAHLTDFIAWVGDNIALEDLSDPVYETSKQISTRRSVDDSLEDSDPMDDIKAAKPNLDETYFDKQRVRSWALNFLNLLKMENEKAPELFYLKFCRELEPKNIATIMAYQKRADVYTGIRRLKEMSQDFARPLDWINPDDNHLQAQQFFKDFLCDNLKNELSMP